MTQNDAGRAFHGETFLLGLLTAMIYTEAARSIGLGIVAADSDAGGAYMVVETAQKERYRITAKREVQEG